MLFCLLWLHAAVEDTTRPETSLTQSGGNTTLGPKHDDEGPTAVQQPASPRAAALKSASARDGPLVDGAEAPPKSASARDDPWVDGAERGSVKEELMADMLKRGQFKGTEGADEVPPIVMANVSMLQLLENIPDLHKSALRFERLEKALGAIESKVDDLLENKYEHGHLVMETAKQSHVVRAMVPRGHQDELHHALMLERGWWSSYWTAATAAVAVIETVVVDVVVTGVTWVVDVVVKAVKTVASALKEAMDVVTGLLNGIASAILRAMIGCNPLPAAQKLTKGVTGTLSQKLADWVKDWVFDKLESAGDLERDDKPDPMLKIIKALELRVEAWEAKKEKCFEEHEKEDLFLAIAKKRDECLAKLGRAPADEAMTKDHIKKAAVAYETGKGKCLATYREAITEWNQMMISTLGSKNDDPCPDLGPRPRLTDDEKEELQALGELERAEFLALEKKKKGAEPTNGFMNKIFDKKIKHHMKTFISEVKQECTNLWPASDGLEREHGSLEQVAREMDVWPSFERRRVKNCGGNCGCSDAKKKHGCTSCKCDPSVCLSVALAVSVGASWVSGNAGGEIGACLSESGKLTAFFAAGGGVGFGVGQNGASIDATLAITALRDIGDVAGHALMAGCSIGEDNFAAVWAVGGAAASTAAIKESGGDAEGFLSQMMSTAFVGISYGVGISVGEDLWTETFGDTTDFGASIDLAWAFGWDIPDAFKATPKNLERDEQLLLEESNEQGQLLLPAP